MSVKTKIISLALLGLLILPALLFTPRPTGNVLGVSEKNEQPFSQVSEKTKIGEIGSGAIDIRTVEREENKGKIHKGKAVWDANAKSKVSTDKFSLGTGIKVTGKSKDLNLVVGDVRVLSAETLIVVDKTTFTDLGGNPDTDENVDITISVD